MKLRNIFEEIYRKFPQTHTYEAQTNKWIGWYGGVDVGLIFCTGWPT